MNEPSSNCDSCGTPFDGVICPTCAWQELFVSESDQGLVRSGGLAEGGLQRLDEIGRGGMGVIYRARQAEPERIVALKMLAPHQLGSMGARERFRAEIRAIATLDHPAILPVYQVGEDNGLPWFTMKFAAGGSLAENIARLSGQWIEQARLIATLAEAVQFAHDRGVLHRDLKPANVLFDETGRPYVSDFGLAKFLSDDAELTATRTTLGTPAYLAPEILNIRGSGATTAADVYGLGTILYELLVGRPAFVADTVAETFRMIAECEPRAPREINPAVPRDLELICLKCLAKKPAARYATARALAEDLQNWLSHRPIQARAASSLERFSHWCQRNPSVAALTGLLLVGGLATGIILGLQNRALQRALRNAESASAAERASLRAALVAQARNLGSTTRPGRRTEALALLHQAASIPRPPAGSNYLDQLRDETVAALARADVSFESRWPLPLRPEDTFSFVAFSDDLEKIALSHDGETLLLAAKNREVMARLPIEVRGSLSNLRFNSDASLLALLEANGDGSIWILSNATRLVQFNADEGTVSSIDFHPAGKTFAVGRRGGPIELRGVLGRLLGGWPVTNALVARYSPDGAQLAVVTESALELWQNKPMERLWAVPIVQPVHRVEWSAKGESLLAASLHESAILLFNAKTGSLQARHQGHSQGPVQFEFHPSGAWVASAARDGSIHLWDAATGESLLQLAGASETLRFHRDGQRLGYAPTRFELGTLQLPASPVFRQFQTVGRAPTPPEKMLVTPDGSELITISSLGLRRWNTRTGEQIELIALPGRGRTWGELGTDGRELVFGRRNTGAWRRERAAFGAARIPLPLAAAGAIHAISPRNEWLVSTGENSLELWPDGERTRARLVGRVLGGFEHQLSPDARWVALSHRVDNVVRVVDTTNGQIVAELADAPKLQRNTLPRAWFTPNSRHLLTSNRREFQFWETGTWRLLWSRPASSRAEASGTAAISGDGRFAALESDPDQFQLIELPSGRAQLELRPPTQLRAAEASFSPDGRRFFIAGAGPCVFAWDLEACERELKAMGLE